MKGKNIENRPINWKLYIASHFNQAIDIISNIYDQAKEIPTNSVISRLNNYY